jgi:hypothetical protein
MNVLVKRKRSIKITHVRQFQRMGGRLIAETQLCPVFIWCRTVDIGAHHTCWLLLQALFMVASALTVASATAMRTITKEVFIVTVLRARVKVSMNSACAARMGTKG